MGGFENMPTFSIPIPLPKIVSKGGRLTKNPLLWKWTKGFLRRAAELLVKQLGWAWVHPRIAQIGAEAQDALRAACDKAWHAEQEQELQWEEQQQWEEP